MMRETENGQVVSVPPGFRFHPTDEELLYYYLRKKVSYEAIDLDVIREVDLNKLEPWDLKEKCRIGSGPQNEWYFFSHKDKKYPTGTRTNRATAAGFWKATGRDKVIHLTNNSKRIGMRKTLVFYTGRAPHGQKTDWIMHEYRLDDIGHAEVQEDGWVVCRVFKKKTHTRNYDQPDHHHHHIHSQQEHQHFDSTNTHHVSNLVEPKQNHHVSIYDHENVTIFDGSMQLPQLFSNESSSSTVHHHQQQHHHSFLCHSLAMNNNNTNVVDMECSQNLLRLTAGVPGLVQAPVERFTADWSFLDKLLTAPDHQTRSCNPNSSQISLDHHLGGSSVISVPRFPFHYLGCEATENFKISK